MLYQPSALRVLICEDEFLLAAELENELVARGATVCGVHSTLAGLLDAIADGEGNANAAILDLQLRDGMAYTAVRPLLEKGIAVVFCSGYQNDAVPAEFESLPLVSKPAVFDDVLGALTHYESLAHPRDALAASASV